MDHFFRIAFCACFCLQGLQATPVRSPRATPSCTINMSDMGFNLLNNVSCVNYTLSSPKDIEPDCQHAALEYYKDQLTIAHAQCNKKEYIMDTLDTLYTCTGLRQADCNLTLTAHKTFESFKATLRTFVQELKPIN